jgi:hypothetical protein
MTHPSPGRHQVSLTALWFGLFAAPAVWSLQLLLLYPVVAHACFPRDRPLSVPLLSSDPIVLLVSVAALAVDRGGRPDRAQELAIHPGGAPRGRGASAGDRGRPVAVHGTGRNAPERALPLRHRDERTPVPSAAALRLTAVHYSTYPQW